MILCPLKTEQTREVFYLIRGIAGSDCRRGPAQGSVSSLNSLPAKGLLSIDAGATYGVGILNNAQIPPRTSLSLSDFEQIYDGLGGRIFLNRAGAASTRVNEMVLACMGCPDLDS